MKKALNFAITFILFAVMCFTTVSALNLSEASTSILTPGVSVSGTVMEQDPENTYGLQLSNSGTVTISVNSPVPYFTLNVYDASGKKILGEDIKCGGKVFTKDIELTSGSYYIDMVTFNKSYGSYSLLVDFTASGETFFENQNGSNNSIVDSVNFALKVNETYKGHLALNDYDDYFKIELPEAGVITLDIETQIASLNAEFFDGNGSKAWSNTIKFENGKFTTNVALTAGTYYFHVSRNASKNTVNYGMFSFKFNFVSANETIVESQNGSNNKIAIASPIDVNKVIGGLIAYNDIDDYYKLTLEDAGSFELQLNSKVDSFKIEFLDTDGKKKLFEDEASCSGFTYSKSFDLTAGVYYFHVSKNKDFYGAYTLNFKYVPSNESFTEASGGTNNTTETASNISINKSYIGNLAINDSVDYYCFSTSFMDDITVTLNSSVPALSVKVIDAKSGNILLNAEAVCNGNPYRQKITLAAGIYYLYIGRLNNNTGTYSFTVSGTPGTGSNVRITNFGSLVSTWAVSEAEEAYSLGLIPSILAGTDLTEKVNRAEFAAIAVSLYEYITNSKVFVSENPFIDISSNKFMNEIIKASNLGITAGTSDNTFSPNNLITREQMATMLCRAYKKKVFPEWTVKKDSKFPLDTEGAAKFSDDGQVSSYAKEAVYFMAAKGIINGVDEAGVVFAPQNIATREQAIIIALRCAKNLK